MQKGEKHGAASTHPAFYGNNGLAYFMPFTDADRNEQYAKKRIGLGLIDFIELDLSKYRLWLEAAKRYATDIHDWKLTEQDDLLEIMHQGDPSVSLMPYYLIEYLDEMFFLNLPRC